MHAHTYGSCSQLPTLFGGELWDEELGRISHRLELRREGGVVRQEVVNTTLLSHHGLVASVVMRMREGVMVYKEVEPVQVLELVGNAGKGMRTTQYHLLNTSSSSALKIMSESIQNMKS